MNPLIFLGLLVSGGGAALVTGALHRPKLDLGAVLAELEAEGVAIDEFSARLAEPIASRLLRPAARKVADIFGGLLPARRADQVRHRLIVAGVSHVVGPEEFVLLQGIGLGAGALGGLLIGQLTGAGGLALVRPAVLLGAIGLLGPRSWLSRHQSERQSSIRRDLPDVLDLLAISVEAGAGFESAVAVVVAHFDGHLAGEFRRMLREMELGLPRRDALTNLKRRTEVPELSNFVLILVQADALGMPIGRVLRTQATEMRNKRRQWAREKAARLPVKILAPLTLFILPALFVIVLGPAVIGLRKLF